MHCYSQEETIAAIATPPGEGGVAVIRISGKEAIAIAAKIFSGKVAMFESHRAYFGKVLSLEKEILDECLLMVMRAPRSYTGEDTVEIFCHGGRLITRRVLDAALSAGARPAGPGEFTLRAFMNNKIDLVQAEAVQQIIAAKSELALGAASEQLYGNLSSRVQGYQERLTQIMAIFEAWVDFPDEGLEFASFSEVQADLEAICNEMEKLIATFHEGKMIQDGLYLCLLGSPNVGKSSLMNALLNTERAIVSETPGTTRDTLEEDLKLHGLHFRLVDTAGVRKTEEHIEKEGIRRTEKAMEKADLILLVMDSARPLDEGDKALLASVPKEKTILVWNKIDLPSSEVGSYSFPYTVRVSAKQQSGLEELKEAIASVIWRGKPPSKEEIVITNVRHKNALVQAVSSCRKVIVGLQTDLSAEFISMDMRKALQDLGRIIGTDITEDVLSAIFSTFCVGK